MDSLALWTIVMGKMESSVLKLGLAISGWSRVLQGQGRAHLSLPLALKLC